MARNADGKSRDGFEATAGFRASRTARTRCAMLVALAICTYSQCFPMDIRGRTKEMRWRTGVAASVREPRTNDILEILREAHRAMYEVNRRAVAF